MESYCRPSGPFGRFVEHLLDRELSDEEKTFDVDGNERPQIVNGVIHEGLREIYAGVVDERVDRRKHLLSCDGGEDRRSRQKQIQIDQREFI
jgi:hypothetical protein